MYRLFYLFFIYFFLPRLILPPIFHQFRLLCVCAVYTVCSIADNLLDIYSNCFAKKRRNQTRTKCLSNATSAPLILKAEIQFLLELQFFVRLMEYAHSYRSYPFHNFYIRTEHFHCSAFLSLFRSSLAFSELYFAV